MMSLEALKMKTENVLRAELCYIVQIYDFIERQ
jgi:hypothetical protein